MTVGKRASFICHPEIRFAEEGSMFSFLFYVYIVENFTEYLFVFLGFL
jgi:hypothetical protein